MNWADGIRWTLTAILMVLVWRHTHWSVAMAIISLTVNSEIGSAAMRLVVKRLKANGAL